MVAASGPGSASGTQRLAGDQYFSANDVPAGAALLGSIFSSLPASAPERSATTIFRTTFQDYLSVGEVCLARLPQRLLGTGRRPRRWLSLGTSTALHPSDLHETVRIELSRGGGTTLEPLFFNTRNDGSETWISEGDPSTTIKVRISSRNLADAVSDVSSSDFTLSL